MADDCLLVEGESVVLLLLRVLSRFSCLSSFDINWRLRVMHKLLNQDPAIVQEITPACVTSKKKILPPSMNLLSLGVHLSGQLSLGKGFQGPYLYNPTAATKMSDPSTPATTTRCSARQYQQSPRRKSL